MTTSPILPWSRVGSAGARSGFVPVWVPLLVVGVGFALLLRASAASVEQRGLTQVELTRRNLDPRDCWWHPSWSDTVDRILLELRVLRADDHDAIERLRGRLEALPFVAQVSEPEVLWPDGLRLQIQVHQPIADIRVGNEFLPVAAIYDDAGQLTGAIVLPSRSYTPHPTDGGASLPVLKPFFPAHFDQPCVGDLLRDPALLDALDVARSMAAYLDDEARGQLGRHVIDATRADAFDGLPGGVVIDLEQRRRIHFGHAPRSAGLGELRVRMKWQAVQQGLSLWMEGAGERAWDVRWDEPRFVPLSHAPR